MKKIFKLFIIFTFMFILTGCFKSEELDKADIYTTTYPIEFIVKELYGYNSEVKSIYPDGININEYELSKNKIQKYSKSDLFVYNGLTDEKKIAANFLNNNKHLKIIDVTEGLAIKYSFEELWLNPLNYLMLTQNIKNGLKQYIESTIIKDEIEANYNKLKTSITEFETNLKLISQNGKSNILIVSKDYFKFLESYGFEIISLENTDDLSNDTINRAKNLLANKENNFVFITDSEKDNVPETIKDVLKSGGETKVLNTLTILNSEQRNNNETYITLMQENIEFIKEEIYK